ncbi:MAG: hypothetical protein GF317_12705 [Candidatus Lokiarchaeota archaeon]|nr:hypothetical protein [Candidatus Lokiarchaeota archaeon]
MERLLVENNIKVAKKGERHYRNGWVHLSCPFCIGNPGFHLGWNEEDNYFNCWRCGYKKTELVISKILKLSYDQSRELLYKYGIRYGARKIRKESKEIQPLDEPDIYELTDKCRKYLISRGFDNPDSLVDHWGIGYGGHVGDLKHRITIPIVYQDILVSLNGLRISNKQNPKYKFYKTKTYDLNKILYGIDYCVFNYIFLVEGFIDVWKMGQGYASALMGSGFSFSRINLLLDYDYIFIMTDMDKQGRQTANKIKEEFDLLGKFSKILKYDKPDPGDLSISEARRIREREIQNIVHN